MKKTGTFLVLLTIAALARAQHPDSCSLKLAAAQRGFENGNFEEVIQLLRSCLGVKSYRHQKPINMARSPEARANASEARRMLALAYMLSGDMAATDKAIASLLASNPQYARLPNPADPAEFSRRVAGFSVLPLLSIQLNFGVNASHTLVDANYQPTGSSSTYISRPGSETALQCLYHLSPRWQTAAGISWQRVSYQKYMPSVSGWEEQNIERLRYATGTVQASYAFGRRLIKPLLGLGIQAAYLYGSLSELSYRLLSNNFVQVVNDVDTRAYRQRWQYNLCPAAGLLLPAGDNARFVLTLNTALGLRNVVNPAQRYSNSTFLFNHFYVEDDLRLLLPGISLGYRQTIAFRVAKAK